jgi:hypothetical protein
MEELLSYVMQRSTQCTIITCMLLHAVALAENREQTLAAAAAAATRSDGTAQQNTTHITLYAVPLCVRERERESERERECEWLSECRLLGREAAAAQLNYFELEGRAAECALVGVLQQRLAVSASVAVAAVVSTY